MSNTTSATKCPNCNKLTHLSYLKKNCDWCGIEIKEDKH